MQPIVSMADQRRLAERVFLSPQQVTTLNERQFEHFQAGFRRLFRENPLQTVIAGRDALNALAESRPNRAREALSCLMQSKDDRERIVMVWLCYSNDLVL